MAKKRQTFSKMSRDRELKEKREAKRQKRADRKAAAAERKDATGGAVPTRPLPPTIVNDVER